MWKRLFLVVFILLSFEIGLFLVLFPWSPAWERNLILDFIPLLRGVLQSPFLRGAVSGLGLVNILLGLGEAWHFRDRIRAMELQEAQAAQLEPIEKT